MNLFFANSEPIALNLYIVMLWKMHVYERNVHEEWSTDLQLHALDSKACI